MAIINCPACGEEVSDQATNCVHCGVEIKPVDATDKDGHAEEPLCAECGKPIEPGAEICPNCGCPVKKGEAGVQGEASAGGEGESASSDEDLPAGEKVLEQRKVKSKTLLIVIAIAVVAIAAIAIGFAVNAHQEQVRQEQEAAAAQAAAEKAAADKKAAYNQYIDDMEKSMILMLTGAADAETLGNTVRNVWNSAIFDHSEDAWDEEIRPYFSTDFNEALSNLFADSDTVQKVNDIKANQDSVNELYKKLQNPPEGLANAYSAYEDMHDAYVKLTRLATSPSGSLQSCNNDFREADNDCIEAYEKLKAKMPQKKK